MDKSEKTVQAPLISFKNIFKSSLIGIAVLFISIFISALLINSEKIPMNSEFIVSTFCISLSFLSASLISAKNAVRRKMFSALTCCAIILILLLFSGAGIGRTQLFPRAIVIYSTAALFSSLAGSFVAALLFKN